MSKWLGKMQVARRLLLPRDLFRKFFANIRKKAKEVGAALLEVLAGLHAVLSDKLLRLGHVLVGLVCSAHESLRLRKALSHDLVREHLGNALEERHLERT